MAEEAELRAAAFSERLEHYGRLGLAELHLDDLLPERRSSSLLGRRPQRSGRSRRRTAPLGVAHRAADGVQNRAAPVTSAAPVSLGGYAHTRAECDAVDALRTKVSVIEQLHGRLELVRSIFLHYTAKAMHFKPEVAELPLSMLLMFMKDIKASAARASLTRKCVPPRHDCARREHSTARHGTAQHSTAQHSTVSRRVGWLESTQQRSVVYRSLTAANRARSR